MAKFVLHNDVVPESELKPSAPFIYTDKMVGYGDMYPDKFKYLVQGRLQKLISV